MILSWLLLTVLGALQLVSAFVALEQTEQWEDEDGIIEVSDVNYGQLSQGVEDQFNVVFITMDRVDEQGNPLCSICASFDADYREVAKAFKTQHPNINALWFRADVQQNSLLVKDLQLTHVPHVVVYPPPQKQDNGKFAWGKSAFYQYEFEKHGNNILLHFGDFMGKTLQLPIRLQGDFDVKQFFTYFVITLVIIVALKRLVLPHFSNKAKVSCAVIAFFIVFPSITGYKFTEINGIPFIARDKDGNIMYFSGGTNWQFGIEIFLISMLYIMMAFFTLGLIAINYMSLSSKQTNLLSSLMACALFYTFAYYISCYDVKSPGYPFRY